MGASRVIVWRKLWESWTNIAGEKQESLWKLQEGHFLASFSHWTFRIFWVWFWFYIPHFTFLYKLVIQIFFLSRKQTTMWIEGDIYKSRANNKYTGWTSFLNSKLEKGYNLKLLIINIMLFKFFWMILLKVIHFLVDGKNALILFYLHI